jgi:uncharacterized flavoprotein (TIGR03862 family)
MAAEVAAAGGAVVTVYDRMPSLGRKFLMAGRGGLNLTHSEPFEALVARYGGAAAALRPMLEAFSPTTLVDWAEGLGQPTFIGSSGRVFPKAMKASPLLRAWLGRLTEVGVALRPNHEWRGWDRDGGLNLRRPDGALETARPDATILAMGGASWARLGSNGAWAEALAAAGVPLTPFRPANGGFLAAWSQPFRARFAGSPLKTAVFTFDGVSVRGEAMITDKGVEGGAVYALGARLRDAIAVDGAATLLIDIRPDLSEAALTERLSRPRGGGSLANHLRKAGLTPLAINLLREGGNLPGEGRELPADPAALARLIKAAPIRLTGAAPIDRAISTAGGIAFSGLDDRLMLKARPGVFAAGEMLDWEAPTGGYLLQAAFASGAAAARGALAWLADKDASPHRR